MGPNVNSTTGDVENPWVYEKPNKIFSDKISHGVKKIEEGTYKYY